MQNTQTHCLFCAHPIEVIFIDSTISSKIQRNSTSRRRKFTFHPEKYEVLEDCPNCHKSKSEIQKALTEGVSKPKSKEELKKQLEELGLTGKI